MRHEHRIAFPRPRARRARRRSARRAVGNDERILGFLRDHLDELAFHTAESLAQGAGVSAAAVVRFSRRLGFASFRELRDRARDELQADRADAQETSASVLGRKVDRDIASLGVLPQLLDVPLEEAAAAIAAARTSWFLANRETYGLAVYAQRLLHQVHEDVRLVDPSFADPLRSLGADDVVVACTFRPYAQLTLRLMAYARSAGARLVVVTDGRAHDFIDDATSCSPSRSRARHCCCRSRPPCASWRRWRRAWRC